MIISILIRTLLYAAITFIVSQKLRVIGGLIILAALATTGTVALFDNSWYAIVFFLIYITGILVLITYFLAITHNSDKSDKKEFKRYFIEYIIILIPVSTYITFIGLKTFSLDWEFDAVWLLLPKTLPVYWVITILLLVTMLIAVTLTYKTPKSIRKHEE